MSASTGGGRRPAAAAWGALIVGCLGLAALTLLAPSSPSYDPFAWLVWGRQLAGGEAFGLAGGPSWKPLPVLVTAPLSMTGDIAPDIWLVVARAGLLLALAGGYRVAARLAGPWAGVGAVIALLALDDVVSLAWRGASEPLLLACVLWAIERHLAGRRGMAFALGVAAALIRPEAVPFLLFYAVTLWRDATGRERTALAGGLALVPLLWIGVPALAGDPLAASNTASSTAGKTSPWTAIESGLDLTVGPVWLLACLAGAFASARSTRDHGWTTLVLWGATLAWLGLVGAMTAAGYAGVARYMLPAAALASVLAAVAAVELIDIAAELGRRWRPAILALLVASCGVFAVDRILTLDDQVRAGVRVAQAHDDLRDAIDAANGEEALRRCALGGWVAINHTMQTTLAWELHVPLDRVARTLRPPGVVVRGRRSAAIGAPPPVVPGGEHRTQPFARAGVWTIAGVTPPGVPLPAACADVRTRPGGVRPAAQNHTS